MMCGIMSGERIKRRIDQLLDQADAAVESSDWATVRMRALDVLAFDDKNEDAKAYLGAAEIRLVPDQGTNDRTINRSPARSRRAVDASRTSEVLKCEVCGTPLPERTPPSPRYPQGKRKRHDVRTCSPYCRLRMHRKSKPT